jgi:hypothetical protein
MILDDQLPDDVLDRRESLRIQVGHEAVFFIEEPVVVLILPGKCVLGVSFFMGPNLNFHLLHFAHGV